MTIKCDLKGVKSIHGSENEIVVEDELKEPSSPQLGWWGMDAEG
jgi:hypothetical protein